MRARFLPRRAAVALGTGLMLAVAVGCGPTDQQRAAEDRAGTTTGAGGGHTRDAVDKLTAEESATVIARLDGSPREVLALLKEIGRAESGSDGDSAKGRATRLSRAELTFSLESREPGNASESHTPLNKLERYTRKNTRLAAAYTLGGKSVVAYKSVRTPKTAKDRVYIRLQLRELVREGSLDKRDEERLLELARSASELPGSLSSAKQFLKGQWVRVEPNEFEGFHWAVDDFTGQEVTGKEARAAGRVLDGRALRSMLSGLERVLTEESTSHTVSRSGEIERRKVTFPARQVAKELAPLLKPLGLRIKPSDVPDRKVTAEMTIRRGTLAAIIVDLGDLTEGGSAHLPLRLSLSPGDALAPRPPWQAPKLDPQDLLAALLYGRMRDTTA